MPYTRSEKCVYKKKADGSRGKKKGCSDTEEKAKKYMSKLYSLDETDLDETDPMFLGGGAPEEEVDPMGEAILREWVHRILLEAAAESEKSATWATTAGSVLADINKGATVKYDKQSMEKRRSSLRLFVPGLEPIKDKPAQVKAALEKHGNDIIAILTAAGYTDRNAGKPAKIRSSVSGRYPSVAFKTPGEKGVNVYVVLNPGFRLTGGGGNAGPGETELYEITTDSPVFKKFSVQGIGVTFDFDGFKIPGVTSVTKPVAPAGAGGEAKSDINLETTSGLIRLSLKEPRFPTYDGISDGRLKNYPGFKAISDCAKQQLAVKLLQDGAIYSIISQTTDEISLEIKRTGEPAFTIPQAQQIQAVYGTAKVGGPVDYVVSVPAVAEWDIPDPNVPLVKWTGYKIVAQNPSSKFPGALPAFPVGATPVILFRTANDGRYAKAVLQGTGKKKIIVKVAHTRAAIIPLEQRGSAKVIGVADSCPATAVVDTLFKKLAEEIKAEQQPFEDQTSTTASRPDPEPGEPDWSTGPAINANRIRQYAKSQVRLMETRQYAKSQVGLLKERLIIEELTGSDRSEIKRMIKKEIEGTTNKREIERAFNKKFDVELKKALGASFFSAPGKINKFVVDQIYDEVNKWLADTATRNEIADITKQVLVKLYRELSFSSPTIIKRIKV